MLWWLFVIGLLYASVRWEAVGKAVRVILLVLAIVGAVVLVKVGFVPVFLETLLSIPINLAKAGYHLIYHLLFE